MKTLLQINSGMRGSASQSSMLADKIAASLLDRMPAAVHIKRDLSDDIIPHLDQHTFLAFSDPTVACTPSQKAGLALSDTLVSELEAADALVLGAPMYNLMIPSTLKSWLDYVSRAGRTFAFSQAGPIGLLKGKKAYIAMAQGGQFLGTPADLESGYLRMALGLLGIVDIKFIYAEGLAMGPEAAEAGLADAHRQIGAIFEQALEAI